MRQTGMACHCRRSAHFHIHSAGQQPRQAGPPAGPRLRARPGNVKGSFAHSLAADWKFRQPYSASRWGFRGLPSMLLK